MDDMNRTSRPSPAKTTYSYNKTYEWWIAMTSSDRQRVLNGVVLLECCPLRAHTIHERLHRVNMGRTQKYWRLYVVDFGGPCRSRTYGPLIKSANRAVFVTA